MMTQAFYTGVSGIRGNQFAIDVTSHNLANISTTGFRGSEFEFASLFEEAINTSYNSPSNSVGIGSRVQATSMNQSQGIIELSDKNTDLAILGEGWFGIQGYNKPVYTRDGAFTFDANSNLVSQDGLHVLGTMGDNITDSVLTSKLDEITLANVSAQEKLNFPNSLSYPPEPTTAVSYSGNLSQVGGIRTVGASIIDSQSNRKNLQLSFTASEPQIQPGTQWDVTATIESLDGSVVHNTKTGKLEFDLRGALLSNTLTTIENNGVDISIDMGTGYNGIRMAPNSPVSFSSKANGLIGGDLEGYSINKNAEVIATFTNGMQSLVGKIAVYHFQNDQGLERINGSRFQESSNSGRPIFYTDADGNNIIGADIANFKLEGTNVDMTHGITELIILQRAFDANSKSITTADQMMQKALNMDA